MRALFLNAFGLSPLWLDLALLGYSLLIGNQNLAFITSWLLVLALPACAVTTLIARAAVAVHARSVGSNSIKLLNSGAVTVVAVLLCMLLALALWGRRQDEEASLRAEAKVVEAFVAADMTVAGIVGMPTRTSIVTSSSGREDSRPVRYEVAAYGTTTVYAIVGVVRSGSQRQLRLICTTPISMGHRQSGTDPCAK
jgi:hypothetical protein